MVTAYHLLLINGGENMKGYKPKKVSVKVSNKEVSFYLELGIKDCSDEGGDNENEEKIYKDKIKNSGNS